MNESIMRVFRNTVRIIQQHLRNRKIVFWGENPSFEHFLQEEYNLSVECYVTAVPKKAHSKRILLEDLAEKAEQYYIIVTKEQPSQHIKKQFKGMKFAEYKDYIFLHRKNTIIRPFSPDYKDPYGNFVHAGGCRVVIGKLVTDSYVYVDDGFKGDMLIRLFGRGGARATVGQNCKSTIGGRIFIHDNGVLSIGNGVSFGDNVKISISEYNKVTIGDDCMFSYNILMFSGDGHAIFDLDTGRRTNLYLDDDPKGTITLGKHVWVGSGACILNRASIGNSCIIGANSTFKGQIPDYTVAAGNPAKIVKSHVTWSRNPNATEISECFSTWNGATENIEKLESELNDSSEE